MFGWMADSMRGVGAARVAQPTTTRLAISPDATEARMPLGGNSRTVPADAVPALKSPNPTLGFGLHSKTTLLSLRRPLRPKEP